MHSEGREGLRWKESVAPFVWCVIVVKSEERAKGNAKEEAEVEEEQEAEEEAELLKRVLKRCGVPDNEEVLVDNRRGVKFGARLREAKLIGYCNVLCVGNATRRNGSFDWLRLSLEGGDEQIKMNLFS